VFFVRLERKTIHPYRGKWKGYNHREELESCDIIGDIKRKKKRKNEKKDIKNKLEPAGGDGVEDGKKEKIKSTGEERERGKDETDVNILKLKQDDKRQDKLSLLNDDEDPECDSESGVEQEIRNDDDGGSFSYDDEVNEDNDPAVYPNTPVPPKYVTFLLLVLFSRGVTFVGHGINGDFSVLSMPAFKSQV
jgi:hypothetical protein